MKRYIHFFRSDFEEKGIVQKKGTIFSVSDEDIHLKNCVELDLSNEQWEDIFNYKYIDGTLIYDPITKLTNENEQFQAFVLLELAKLKAGGNQDD